MAEMKNFLSQIPSKILGYFLNCVQKLAQYNPFSKETSLLLGVYLVGIAAAHFLIKHLVKQIAYELLPHWAPGFGPLEPTYNAPFIHYTFVLFGIVGAFALRGIFSLIPSIRKAVVSGIEKCGLFLLPFSFLILLASLTDIVSFCGSFAAILFLLLAQSPNIVENNHFIETTRPTWAARKLFPWLLCLLLFLSLGMVAKAWYPVQLPNDYLEIPESVLVQNSQTGAEQIVSRSAIIDCMEAQRLEIANIKDTETPDRILARALSKLTGVSFLVNKELNEHTLFPILSKLTGAAITNPPKCALDISSLQLGKLRAPILTTGVWEMQAGRILYHHSYLVVPALHALKYGVFSPIPYLYGFGNTLFHALLLRMTSPTLTSYFNTFPVAQLLGILALAALVLYVTRSYFAVCTATALVLIAFFQLGFEYVLLPPGFSPLRGAGLALQVASIFWLFRGTSQRRPIGLLFALAFSFLWNKEFALFGVVGQIMALLSLQFECSLLRRSIYLIGVGCVLVICMCITAFLERGFLQNIYLGLLGTMPTLSHSRFLIFCIAMALLLAFLVILAKRFDGKERAARFCVLPVIALMTTKYLYFAWAVHLYYALMLVLPMIVVYFKWHPVITRAGWNLENQHWKKRIFC